jgi:hypothetical protein
MVGTTALSDLRYITFDIVSNSWEGQPSVPLFGVTGAAQSAEEQKVIAYHYGLYLRAKKQYNDDAIRERRLLPSNITAVQQKLLSAPVGTAQLEAGSVEDIEDM